MYGTSAAQRSRDKSYVSYPWVPLLGSYYGGRGLMNQSTNHSKIINLFLNDQKYYANMCNACQMVVNAYKLYMVLLSTCTQLYIIHINRQLSSF